MREAVDEERLVQFTKIWNYCLLNPGFEEQFVIDPSGIRYGSPTPGVIGQWNNQAANPYYEVDFGKGAPDRGVPWFFRGEPLKVVPSAKGGVEVLLYHGEGNNG